MHWFRNHRFYDQFLWPVFMTKRHLLTTKDMILLITKEYYSHRQLKYWFFRNSTGMQYKLHKHMSNYGESKNGVTYLTDNSRNTWSISLNDLSLPIVLILLFYPPRSRRNIINSRIQKVNTLHFHREDLSLQSENHTRNTIFSRARAKKHFSTDTLR